MSELTITNPQRKLLLKIQRNPTGSRLRLKGGEWVAARALRGKGLLTSTYPIPTLTPDGSEVCKKLTH